MFRNPINVERLSGFTKKEKLAIVNAKLKEKFIDIDELLLDAIVEKIQSPTTHATTDEYPAMSSILNAVDRKLQKKPEFLRLFVSFGIRYCWIGFRKSKKEFAGLEQIINGLHMKDLKVIAKGVVTFAIESKFSTILFELVKRNK